MMPEKKHDTLETVSSHTINFVGGLIQNRASLVAAILLVPLHLEELTSIPVTLLIGTGFGIETNKIYRRTLFHLKKHQKFDSRFFQVVMEGYLNDRLLGYCQLQGMYLAAKKCGYEEDFFRLKKEHTKNIVPNF